MLRRWSTTTGIWAPALANGASRPRFELAAVPFRVLPLVLVVRQAQWSGRTCSCPDRGRRRRWRYRAAWWHPSGRRPDAGLRDARICSAVAFLIGGLAGFCQPSETATPASTAFPGFSRGRGRGLSVAVRSRPSGHMLIDIPGEGAYRAVVGLTALQLQREWPECSLLHQPFPLIAS